MKISALLAEKQKSRLTPYEGLADDWILQQHLPQYELVRGEYRVFFTCTGRHTGAQLDYIISILEDTDMHLSAALNRQAAFAEIAFRRRVEGTFTWQ